MRSMECWLAVGLVSVAGLVIGNTALASPLEFDASLTLEVGFGGGTASGSGAGMADVYGDGSFVFPAAVLELAATFPVKVGPVSASIVVDAKNPVATLTPRGGFPRSGFGGPMPLSGDLGIPQVTPRRLPMSFVGSGSAPSTFRGTTRKGDTWVIFLGGRDWTTGAVRTTVDRGAKSTLTGIGTDQRTSSGAGAIKLVTPFRITVYTEGQFQAAVPGIATLDIEFVPEPRLALAYSSALTVLVAMGLRRRRFARDSSSN